MLLSLGSPIVPTERPVLALLPPAREAELRPFLEGEECRLWTKLGAHPAHHHGQRGVRFSVWAPNAQQVSVMGNFNDWRRDTHWLTRAGATGVWDGFVPGAASGQRYKYAITGRDGKVSEKADPVAFWSEEPPRTASVVWGLDYPWGDEAWVRQRARQNYTQQPVTIYELHPGSWMRVPEEKNRWLTWRELAAKLCEYLPRMGFTHVELLPVMEHPFYGSWGYQPTGFYAPTSRYGTPQDFMYFVDELHRRGLGVILDWVPFHFPMDAFALAKFDGTDIYAHPDPRRGYHPTWKSAVFDLGRPEVRSFLLSSALYWFEMYHIDGLRVDAVSYMLFHNYYRKQGEWLPNEHGGSENLEAVDFLRRLNTEVHRQFPGALMIAEEASTFPKVSHPVATGGLGFDYKWDMGWMNDTLQFMRTDGQQRRRQLNKLTFRMMYAFSESFLLSLSHDEVVHLKGSLWHKMWGNAWQKFAGLRLLYGYMYSQPGKKLLFMGGEFGHGREWNHDQSLDWHLTEQVLPSKLQRCVRDLNHFYQTVPALHELDSDPAGFEWIACDDTTNGIFSYLRKPARPGRLVLVVCNFSPNVLRHYRVGVPEPGLWRELFNSDAAEYGGSGLGNFGGLTAEARGWNWRPHSLNLTVPPLAVLFFEHTGQPTVEPPHA